jgi:hypothetical protein
MGGVCNPIVVRGPAFAYPPAITRQRAGSSDLAGTNPVASRAKYNLTLLGYVLLTQTAKTWLFRKGWVSV